jgi:hypothetical protein
VRGGGVGNRAGCCVCVPFSFRKLCGLRYFGCCPGGSLQVQSRLVASCWSSLNLAFTMHGQMIVRLKLIYVFKVLNWFYRLQVDGTGSRSSAVVRFCVEGFRLCFRLSHYPLIS